MDNETFFCKTCNTTRVHQGIGKNVAYCRKCGRLHFPDPWDNDWVYFIDYNKSYDSSD